MMEEEEAPKIFGIYKGTVFNVDNLGYHVRLTDFKQKEYKGQIHKTLVDSELAKKLTRGRYVKVKITAVGETFVVISLDSIEEEFDIEEDKKRNDDRVIRISSPERHQVKQVSGTFSYVSVSAAEEPSYLQMMKLKISLNTTGLFSNDAEIPKSFMLSNAVMTRSLPFDDFSSFNRNSNMNRNWVKGDIFVDDKQLSEESAESLIKLWESKKSASVIKRQREVLPIFKVRDDLIRAVVDNRFLIVQGETGSGKSTQIPQYLLEAGFIRDGKIVCTQPRRLATRTLAERVAQEQGCALGEQVGFKHKLVDKTSKGTLIKYCTEGTLLRECLNTSNLDTYSVVILDEAHERTVNTDVLFGFLKKEIEKRPKLRVIVSSATLEAKDFSKFFFDAPIFYIKGRTFPVDIMYREMDIKDYFNAAIATAIYIHTTQGPGDILLFLTGQEEIETACEVLENHRRLISDLEVRKIYAALQFSEQKEVFKPAANGKRKLIISTNIAETSMTIPGIFYVIDPGYTKVKMFEPKSGLELLQIYPISQASADQRTGRAGRTGPGKCFRLYTKKSYDTMQKTSIPEIQRSNLASVVLQFKAMGINDVENFEFMDRPSKEMLYSAEKQLYCFSALNSSGMITEMGKRMVDLPVEPNLAKMLITSIDLKCSHEVITIIAMMSVQNIFYRPRRKQDLADSKKAIMSSSFSDHITFLNVYNAWKNNNYSSRWCAENFVNERGLNEAYEFRELLMQKMDQKKEEILSCGKNFERVQKAICAGLAQNLAKKASKGFKYQTINDSGEAYIHPSSSVMSNAPQWLVYHNLTESFNKKDKNFRKNMRDITAIDPSWLKEYASSLYNVHGLY